MIQRKRPLEFEDHSPEFDEHIAHEAARIKAENLARMAALPAKKKPRAGRIREYTTGVRWRGAFFTELG
jgi:hypothetical protein